MREQPGCGLTDRAHVLTGEGHAAGGREAEQATRVSGAPCKHSASTSGGYCSQYHGGAEGGSPAVAVQGLIGYPESWDCGVHSLRALSS